MSFFGHKLLLVTFFFVGNSYVRNLNLYGDEQNDDCNTFFNSWCDTNFGQRGRSCWIYCAVCGGFIIIACVTRIQCWICIVRVRDEGH